MTFKERHSFDFFNEIINNPEKFKKIQNIFSKYDLLNSKYLKNKNLLFNHPLKSSLEDFYRSNKFTKHSKTMSKCSQQIRKTFKKNY